MELEKNIRTLLGDKGADLVGFADVEGLAPDGYTRAVVAAVALPVTVIDEIPIGPTQEYLDTYQAINRQLDDMAACTEAFLRKMGYRSMAQIREKCPWDREKMATPFPYKTSATRAGLGWIGKCALLVTPQYGSAIRLTAVLTDAPITPGEAITESRCGNCRQCVDACPGGAIADTLWYAGIPREDLVNIPLCDQAARDIAEEKLGYRTTMCGRCFAACPFTQAYVGRAKKAKPV